MIPEGCQVIRVENAAEVCDAVFKEIATADALVMSAAVADFRPAKSTDEKIKKEKGLINCIGTDQGYS